MKKTLLLTVALLGALLGLNTNAVTLGMGGPGNSEPKGPGVLYYSTATTNGATATSYAIISAKSANGGAPVVLHADAITDLATGKLQFYRVDGMCTVTFTNSTTTLFVDGTNGVGDQSGVIVIRHILDDTYEKRTETSNTGTTNLIVTAAPLGTCVPGDIIYHCTTTRGGYLTPTGTNVTASASFRWQLDNAGGIYTGQPNCPLLVEATGTSAATLSSVSAEFRALPR